jgi:hypothetical protein
MSGEPQEPQTVGKRLDWERMTLFDMQESNAVILEERGIAEKARIAATVDSDGTLGREEIIEREEFGANYFVDDAAVLSEEGGLSRISVALRESKNPKPEFYLAGLHVVRLTSYTLTEQGQVIEKSHSVTVGESHRGYIAVNREYDFTDEDHLVVMGMLAIFQMARDSQYLHYLASDLAVIEDPNEPPIQPSEKYSGLPHTSAEMEQLESAAATLPEIPSDLTGAETAAPPTDENEEP